MPSGLRRAGGVKRKGLKGQKLGEGEREGERLPESVSS